MASRSANYNTAELVTVMASRLLEDGKVVFVGAGLPLIAASLAQRINAPKLTILFEGGAVAPQILPGKLPASTNEARAARRAVMLPTCTDMLLYQQRGYVDYAFLGGAQIDQYGNINTSVIGDYHSPRVRLPGGGGGNDLISTTTRSIVVTHHEKRRLVEKVDFVTSPGYLRGGDERRASGLIFGGVYKVVTHLCIMGFDPGSKRMIVEALHPGVELKDVQDNTGFVPLIAQPLQCTESPSERELQILRELDPDRRYTAAR